VDIETDQALLARYMRGDQEAFATLVVRYQKPMYNAAFWVLRNAEDANDVTQDVFLRVAERCDDYDPKYKFFSWIYRITVNEALNFRRRHAREDELDDEIEIPAAGSANPEWQVAEGQQTRRIRTALMSMATNDRMVLMLRHFSELSYEEIAQVLELDEKTVKSRLYEARLRLRELLRDLRPN
jgi:RNA polymerase sigma-70 factor, ECF subfamily